MKGKEALKNKISDEIIEIHSFFEFLKDPEPAPDKDLPKTGVPYGMEKGLSSLFIELPGYGTRCSTAILSNNIATEVTEKTFELANQKAGIVEINF